VEIAPTEPNGHDSLADALLAANRLDEAEGEYKKALEVSPQFFFSWAASPRPARSARTGRAPTELCRVCQGCAVAL